MPDRQFDIIVYGASGFVGRLVARYLAARAGASGLRLAIAGRNRSRLENVRTQLGSAVADVLVADSGDQAAVDALVSRGRVVLNTAGPFARYASGIVDACVRLRTHYVDITGETPWVRSLVDRHHAQAAADGTRIIPCCGFDSVPSDLGAYLVARHLGNAGSQCREVKAYFQLFGGLNGGSLATMMMLSADPKALAQSRDPLLLSPSGSEGSSEDVARVPDPVSPRYDPDAGAWVGPFIMGPINSRVVRRSAALYAQWQQPYGARFAYQEYLKYGGPFGPLTALAVTAGSTAFIAGLENSTIRSVMGALLPQPGSGPSARLQERGWFRCELVGLGDAGRRARGIVRDVGDPGNAVTAKCVGEAALALATSAERLPGGTARGGILTPATGLGDLLVERLRAAGMILEVNEA